MPEARYILLDQGAFRSSRLRTRIATDLDACFVIPDVAFSEMTIKADPILSITKSLEALRPAIKRTFVSLSCREIKELQRKGSPLKLNDVLSGPGTKVARVLLDDASSSEYRTVVESILTSSAEHRALYDGRQDKAAMIDHVEIFGRSIGTAGSKALRAGKITELEKLGMILLILKQIETATGPFETNIDMRHLLVRLTRIVMWVEKQGLKTRTPEKMMNDFIDMEFVVAGSFFDETMTEDKTVAALDRVVRAAMNLEHGKRAVDAAVAIGFKVAT